MNIVYSFDGDNVYTFWGYIDDAGELLPTEDFITCRVSSSEEFDSVIENMRNDGIEFDYASYR